MAPLTVRNKSLLCQAAKRPAANIVSRKKKQIIYSQPQRDPALQELPNKNCTASNKN